MSGRSFLILYGSETGNAQDIAETIFRASRRFLFESRIFSMDEYSLIDIIDEKLVIFVTSTTGQGDVPLNMKKFWKFLLKRNLPSDLLYCLKFAVFGLGDSNYINFNSAARKLEQRLCQLGGERIMPRGEGDEQHPQGIDGGFIPWLNELCSCILLHFPLTENMEVIPDDVLLPPIHPLVIREELEQHMDALSTSRSMLGTIRVQVAQNLRITADDHWQDVRHIILKSSSILNFSPGDVAMVYPMNLEEDVSLFFKLQKYNPKIVVTTSMHPRPIYLHRMVTCHLDLNSIPRRSFFRIVAHFTMNETHRNKLVELSLPENSQDLYDYTSRPRRTILEVLVDFPDISIPLEYLLDAIPPLRPRQFSIANSRDKSEVHLVVALVQYKTLLWKERWGVCSRYLNSLNKGSEICIDIGNSLVTLPNSQTPMILVGPGTGVAPLRSLIQARSEDLASDTVLFFGCRNREKDFLFCHEWGSSRVQLFVAFSRDQKHKIYVQHLLLEHHELVRDIILRGGWVYISGSSGKMPQAVQSTLLEILGPDDYSTLVKHRLRAILVLDKTEGEMEMEIGWNKVEKP